MRSASPSSTNGRLETATAGLLQIRVRLAGLPPGLLMAGKGIMEADQAGKPKGSRRTFDDEAKLQCHWYDQEAGVLGIPWVNLYRSFCQAATYFKWKGAKTFADIVAGSLSCEEDVVSLGDAGYETYPEWVRIPPRTGAMVKLARPRIREWACEFTMVVDDIMYGTKAVHSLRDIVAHAGKMVGIGPWRPSLKGPYGRFRVEKFESA